MMTQLLPQADCLELLCAVPAAAQLSSEAAARLLLEGLKQRQHVAVGQLWGLAGAQQISSELLAELLLWCVRVWTDADDTVAECLAVISSLPAAIKRSSTKLVQLLLAVYERSSGMQAHVFDDELGSFGAFSHGTTLLCAGLLGLPAAAEFSTQQLMQLIQAAALFDNDAAMRGFCISDIAGRVSSEMLLQSLHKVV
jgi:hypothetical protein